MSLPAELEALPPPVVINEIDYAVRLQTLVDLLVAEMAAAGVTYDVNTLETDPAVILVQVAAYIDINLRQRVNEAVRANLLPYATSGDLDILAQFYDVIRLYQETDTALRLRVVLAIQGRSTGGTEPRYRGIALGADVRVADAAVYTVGKDPTVHVAVFATDNNGIADQPLLAAVDAALQAPAVRMVNDIIVVASASQQAVNIEANVWLLPQTAESVLTDMDAALTAAWTSEMALGRDVTPSWIYSKLQIGGIHKVELVTPTADIVVPFNEAAALGTITLNNMGRDY